MVLVQEQFSYFTQARDLETINREHNGDTRFDLSKVIKERIKQALDLMSHSFLNYPGQLQA